MRGTVIASTREFGTDWSVLEKMARLYRLRRRSPVPLDELAMFAGVGLGKVAIAMRIAVADGYAVKVSGPDEQAAWVPTLTGDGEVAVRRVRARHDSMRKRLAIYAAVRGKELVLEGVIGG